jgi:TolB-like protein/DNA-binding winged helix-turn-helix (wHTH) protein/Flp pilus assembly protein TadD
MVMSKAKHRVWEFGSFRLDESERLLLRDGGTVGLTPKVFDTLIALVEHSGHLVEKEELMQRLWPDTFVEEGALTRNISDLRKALGEEQYIETVPKRGYRFVAPVIEIEGDITTSIVEKTTEAYLIIEEEEETDAYGETERSSLAAPLRAEARPYSTVNADHVATDSLLRARPTGDLVPAHSASTRDYIVSEIKRHKRAAAVALSILLLATVGIGYWSFVHHSSKVRTPIASIAVLPFVNTSNNPDAEYLSDGISESLINSLSQVPGVKVIARSSSFKHKGNEIDPQQVAGALGVEGIVMGRIAQRNENMVISAELVDARDKTQVWGEQYNRKSSDIQAVEEEIARTIAEKLRSRLTGSQELRLTKRATENPQAYQFYLNGLYYRRKGGFYNVKKALDYFNQAVAVDSYFALAWVGIADSNLYFAGNSLVEPKESLGKAKPAVQKALELDESLAEAHIALGIIRLNEWDWTGAEREYERALELNPNLVDAHRWYSNYLSLMERHTEAIAEIKRAQELDPLENGLRISEAWALNLAGRHDEAIEKYQQIMKIEPSFGRHFGLGFTYENKGMYGQAIEEFQKGIKLQGETTSGLCYLGYNLAMAGRRVEPQSILARLKNTKEYVSAEELAGLYAGLGDKEGALAALEKAYAEHDLQMQVIKIDSRLNGLRSDPRFQDLLQRMRFP